MTTRTDRRTFLKSAVAASAALVIGLRPDGRFAVAAAGAAPTTLNPFVRITADGTVEVVLKHFEMGQGTTTGLTTLVAEELDADWQRVTTDFAPADAERYKNLAFGAQGTRRLRSWPWMQANMFTLKSPAATTYVKDA